MDCLWDHETVLQIIILAYGVWPFTICFPPSLLQHSHQICSCSFLSENWLLCLSWMYSLSSANQYLNMYPILSCGFWVSQHILLLELIFFRSSKERFRDQDLASRDRDRNSRDRSPRDRDRKDKKRSYESANGRSEDRRSSEEREAGEI